MEGTMTMSLMHPMAMDTICGRWISSAAFPFWSVWMHPIFIEDVITKRIVYHLFDDEVEFLGCVFLSYLSALEITCSTFHDFIDKDLIDLVLPDVRRYVVLLTGIYYHLKELRCCAQCLIEDEDFIKRSRSTLGEEVDHYIEPTEFEIQEMLIICGGMIQRISDWGKLESFVSFREMITSQLQGKLRLYDEVSCALRYFDLEVMELENTQNNVLAKLPMLKLGEYEMWEIRIKQYF
ncbi:hypothetical protein Tco_1330225 [Tanacetum coccineum]